MPDEKMEMIGTVTGIYPKIRKVTIGPWDWTVSNVLLSEFMRHYPVGTRVKVELYSDGTTVKSIVNQTMLD